MGSIVKSISSAIKGYKIFTATNPWVALGITLFISWILRPKTPEIEDFGATSFDDFEKGLLVNKQSNDANIPVIYGERLSGGVRVFMESSGTDNTYLYMCIVMSEGEINDLTSIIIDDKTVTWSGDLSDNIQRTVGSGDSNFYKDSASLITVEPHYGTDGQSASSLLSTLSSWGSNHKLSGLCYIALRFTWNQDAFTGVPKVQAKIQGKKVVTYNSSLVAQSASYSTNPSWCLLDYLTNARYGKGLTTSEIDLQSFYDASQTCITQVAPYSGGSNINIFDCNTAIDTSKNIIDNVRELVKGCRGYVPYSAGKYKLIIETTGSAAITLTEDDIIGGYSLSTPNKNEKYNRVICSYINPDRNYQVDEVQFPPIDDSGLSSADQHATMKTADGGFLLEGRFDFPSITNPYQAQELAEVICRRSRNNLNLALRCDSTGMDLMVGELVNVTHSTPSFSAKTFRIQGMQINADLTTELQMTEYQSSYYTWATQNQVATIPDTNLPSVTTVQPPASVTLSDEMIEYSDGVVLTRLNILVGASTDKFVQYYQVETKQTSESDYKVLSQGVSAVLNYQQLNVVDDVEYSVRVKAISSMGFSSSYVTATRQIVGATEIPEDVSDLSISMVGSNQMELTWTPVSDLDISWYELRYENVTSGATWNTSTPLTKVTRRKSDSVTVNAMSGVGILIKAVDKLGNSSASENIVYTNISGLQYYSNQATYTE